MKTGFSLSELLIALLILGQIATFMIPKVLNAQQNGQRTAIFKSSIAAMHQVLQLQLLEGTDDGQTYNAVKKHINAVRFCDSSSDTQCAPPGGCAAQSGRGFALHNGAMVSGLDNAGVADGKETFCIDWNGNQGPNIEGVDQIRLRLNYWGGDSTHRNGTISASNSTSRTLYEEIFR